MKRLSLAIFFLFLWAAPADAINTYNCDYLTGGAQRALDYISVDDLNNGDRAIVVYRSGSNDYYLYFKYDSSGVTAEQTATHPYYIRPNDYVTSGVWCEVAPNWGHLGGPLESLYVTNLTSHVFDASKAKSGASPIYGHTSGTSVILGTFILNDSATSKIYGLPLIPATGVSLPYTIFSEGAAGAGMTIYPTAAQPFQGDGLSGTSYLALPPGKPFESATLFGVNNGVTAYWFVQKSVSWVAGN